MYREAVRRLAELEARERNRTKAARPPVVLSTRAISVKSFQDNAAEVVLERCIDRPDAARTRNGVRRPAAHDEPVVQEVVVVRYENRTWRIGPFTTTDRPCEG